MADDDRVVDLLLEWEDSGQRLTAEELCASCPELLSPLREAIRRVRAADVQLSGAGGAPSGESSVPGQIGNYRLLEVIGEGSQGVVYKAEQQHPRRIVALKVIWMGLFSQARMRRFQLEQKVLGRLEHPGIARIYEAGIAQTPQGRQPFFAMEYVQGKKLTEYAEKMKLGTRERLELLGKICEAVHHSHQKGVVHRDLKPANILVDEGGQPKIVDFGVAKLTELDLRATAPHTSLGQLVGTLQYASPEQASGRLNDIDTRSDIYALGVVAYELLSGRLPYELGDRAALEAVRVVCEEEPTSLSTVDRSLRGDVETIVYKALAKDKESRYASASDLAADIRRYLSDEPITARPASTWYQASKFAKRNRVLVGSLCVVMALLLVSTIVFWRQRNWATSEQQRADKNAGEAATAAADARASERKAQERLAEGLMIVGDSLLRSGETGRARDNYFNALGIGRGLGNPEMPVRMAFLESWEIALPPLMGDDGTRSSIGGFSGDKEEVLCVAFSPDGRSIVSGCGEGTLSLWDVRTGLKLRSWGGDKSGIMSVAFAPDGRSVVSGSRDKTLKLWEVGTGNEIRGFSGHKSWVSCVAFSPDGRSIVSGSADGTLKLWDAGTSTEIHHFTGHKGPVCCVAFSPDGRNVISGSFDATLKLWDVDSGAEVRSFSGHRERVRCVAFLPDGHNIISGSEDTTLKLWDVGTAREVRSFSGHKGPVCSVAFSPDGRRLASGSLDAMLKLWNVQTGEEIRGLCGHKGCIPSVAFAPDGRSVVSASFDGTLKLWDVGSAKEIRNFCGSTNRVSSIALSPDGSGVVSGSADGTLELWDAGAARGVRSFFGHTHRISCVAFSADGRSIISGGQDKTLKLWDVGTGREIRGFSGNKDGVLRVAFSPDGRNVFSASADGILKVWDIGRDREIRSSSGHTNRVSAAAFSPDGKRAVFAGSDGTLMLWDVETGMEIRSVSDDKSAAFSLAFSPDGRSIACGRLDATLKLWDVGSGREIRSFLGHTGPVLAVAFAPDGRNLVSGSTDGTFKVWDVGTGKEIRSFSAHKSEVFAVAFSRDGRRIVCGSHEAARDIVRLFDLRCPERYLDFEQSLPKAREALSRNPTDGAALAAFGEWWAFRGVDDWAVEFFEKARANGGEVSALTLAHCYWRLDRLADAKRELQSALEKQQAPEDHLRLCLGAVDATIQSASIAATRAAGQESGRPTMLLPNGWKPVWLADGKGTLFTKDPSGLWKLDFATGVVRTLELDGSDASVSPDGAWIAFVRRSGNGGGVEEVWLSDGHGGFPRKLVVGGYPSWSPNSREVIYHARRDNKMYSMAVGEPDAQPKLFYAQPRSWYPAVSHDLSRIAFGPKETLLVVDRQTGQEVLRFAVPKARGVVADFSPDGNLIAAGGFDNDPTGLWVIDLKRNRAAKVMEGAYTGPAWSPDGQRLAFDRREGAVREVWVVGRPYLMEFLASRGIEVRPAH